MQIFKRNLDIDFTTACLLCVFKHHAELLVHPMTTSQQNSGDDVGLHDLFDDQDVSTSCITSESGFNALELNSSSVNSQLCPTYFLVEKVMQSKASAQMKLSHQLNSAISLLDLIRHPTSMLHF
ncbi:unnamed protein product [Protopolystoma xenopodis]|uniref:Small-subunit processome Utp21 domain-containing protein n=1 Tax=Protopolystoma xenopodis TaxID=117903 RepID=A0A448WA63_9PLAT|nr:unnamed protein product [Protopolystoma xenopodis]